MNRVAVTVGVVLFLISIIYFSSSSSSSHPRSTLDNRRPVRLPSSPSTTRERAQSLVAITSLHSNIVDSLHDIIKQLDEEEEEGAEDSVSGSLQKRRARWAREKKQLLVDSSLLRLKTLFDRGDGGEQQDNQDTAHDILDELFSQLNKYSDHDTSQQNKNDKPDKTSKPNDFGEEALPPSPASSSSSTSSPNKSKASDVTFEKYEGMTITGNHVFSGEGCSAILEDQCSAPPSQAASLCLSFGDRCIGYTCNLGRSDCQLRGRPITHASAPRFASFYRPGMFEEANELSRKGRERDAALLRKYKGTLAAEGFNWNGTCGEDGYKCVISYGLYGSNSKYTDGAIRNVELSSSMFPGWVCRFYHDSSVPQHVLNKLTSLGAELTKINHIAGGIAGMFWRFLVASDESVDRYIVRDTDSRLNKRDYYAVQEWMKSGYSIHSVRDHPNHNRPLNGGMWGGVKGALSNLPTLIEKWNSRDSYGADLDFLNAAVWPIVENDQISHDSYTCENYKNSLPFPTQRKDYEHVGQVFEHERPRYTDISCCMLNNPTPVVCRKRPEWDFG